MYVQAIDEGTARIEMWWIIVSSFMLILTIAMLFQVSWNEVIPVLYIHLIYV